MLAPLLALAIPVAAAQPSAKARAAVLDGVARCRALTDSAERLACYDQAVGALDEAEKKGDVVVVDRAQVHEAKRQTFGFNINLGPIFDRGGKVDKVEELTTSVASARQNPEGRWIVTTAEGQVWRQTDGEQLFEDPHGGDKVKFHKGALGSFFMTVGRNSPVRAHRDD
jgi:hypothetical protein